MSMIDQALTDRVLDRILVDIDAAPDPMVRMAHAMEAAHGCVEDDGDLLEVRERQARWEQE
jgi:hypothetical protein